MLKKFMAGMLVGVFACMGILQTPAQAAITLLINDSTYFSEPRPELVSSRVYVPLRTISEGLGYDVRWDGDNRVVTINRQGTASDGLINPGRDIAIYINGTLLETDASMGKAYIKAPGYTMVPLRAISEGLGAEVGWHDGLVTVRDHNRQLIEKESRPDTTWAPPKESLPAASDSIAEEPAQPQSTPALPGNRADNMTILGDAQLSLEQVNRYLAAKEVQIKAQAARNGKKFTPFPRNIGALYLSIAPRYGIRGDVALAQAIQETGYFQYGNEVLPMQNNYCGLGAIGRVTTEEDLQKQVFSAIDGSKAHLTVGMHGWCYETPAIGVEAHLQHLYSYASAQPLPMGCELYDGRFNHGNRGKAAAWSDLNGRWAVPGNGYGQIIVEKIWQEMSSY
ncbi:MAG: glucosaminidase domain-containing protein [Clostridiales bacterium]|nr:glucosaminidase domain-containing protein [Clostridiales bacterium]